MAPLTWLVTGCSSGFGEQFVHGILERGDRVIATGRQASTRLEHLKNTGAAILDLDVSAPATYVEKVLQDAMEIYGGIDVLVNNAGYMESCYIEELTPDILSRQLATNLFGPLNLTRGLLPHFRAKRSGTFVFISSICGWRGDPSIASYSASKFALEGLVESLSQETASFGIRCQIFEPGLFRTNAFSPHAIQHKSPLSMDYKGLDDWVRDYLKSTYGNEPGDPKKGVERMIDVVKGEGMAEGRVKDVPIRLPLGDDALQVLKEKCEATLKICEDWKSLITSTDL